jgi:hypothetical protein
MAEERDESGKNEPGRGFTVTDRRGRAGEEPAPSAAPEPGPAPSEPSARGSVAAPPPINFTTFVFSLSSSALIQLGEIPDPFSEQVGKNLTAAQQTIDILGLLEEKTKGNLDEEEDRTLEAILYDLRMRFLKASGRL